MSRSKMCHPCLVTLYGVTAKSPRLVMEFIQGGDLHEVLFTQSGRAQLPQSAEESLRVRLRIAFDVACALQYLHSLTPPIIHRDLHAGNVFVRCTELPWKAPLLSNER